MRTEGSLKADLKAAGFQNVEVESEGGEGLFVLDEGDVFDTGRTQFSIAYNYPDGDDDFGMRLLKEGERGWEWPADEWGCQIDWVDTKERCLQITRAMLKAGWHVLPGMPHEEVSDSVEYIYATELLPEGWYAGVSDEALVKRLEEQKAEAEKAVDEIEKRKAQKLN